MPRIFISYRREDAAAEAGRIADRFRAEFGADDVFFDVDTIEGGALFPKVIEERIDACDVVLVIIGKAWLTERLNNEGDWVRREVERGLTRKVRLIPVLVSKDARMPKTKELPASLAELPEHNAVELIYGPVFDYQMQGLIDTVRRRKKSVQRLAWNKPLPWVVAAAAVGALVGGLIWTKARNLRNPAPTDFHLQVSMQLDPQFGPVAQAPVMKLRQKLPKDLGTNELTPGGATGAREFEYQPQFIFMPERGQQYQGDLHREVTGGVAISAPSWSTICFERKAEALAVDPTVRLRCKEGAACQLADDDFGWAAACGVRQQSFWRRLVPVVEAKGEEPKKEAAWAVPALGTLRKQEAEKRNPAYSEFVLGSGPLTGLETADRMTYAVRVNGSPLYFDGLPPDSIPFDAKKGINLVFGLENLNFSGQNAGYEDMDIWLEFKKGSRTVERMSVPVRCVALRTMARTPIVVDDRKMWWKATYHPGRQEDAFQIFLLSIRQAEAAESYKRRLDAAQLRIGGTGIVAVVRPPIGGSSSYGVVLGIQQPSGQIKFTFDQEKSRELCRGINGLAEGSPLIGKTSFRRQVIGREVSSTCGQL